MSLKTWKAEFYPVEASADMTDLEAVRHAIRKFEGARRGNVKKHCLTLTGSCLDDGTSIDFMFNDTTCALCLKYSGYQKHCAECPLLAVRGRPCDVGDDAPYGSVVDGDPEPMLALLREAEAMLLEKGRDNAND